MAIDVVEGYENENVLDRRSYNLAACHHHSSWYVTNVLPEFRKLILPQLLPPSTRIEQGHRRIGYNGSGGWHDFLVLGCCCNERSAGIL